MNQKTRITALILTVLLFATGAAAQSDSRFNATYTTYLDGQSTGSSSFNVGNVQPGDHGMWVVDVTLRNSSELYMKIDVTGDYENSCVEPEEKYEGVGCTPLGELDDNLKFTAWVDDGNLQRDSDEVPLDITENWLKLVQDQTLLDLFRDDKEYRIAVEWRLPYNTTSVTQTDSAELTLKTAATTPVNDTVTNPNGGTTNTGGNGDNNGGGGGGNLINAVSSFSNGNGDGEIENQLPEADFEYTNLETPYNVEFNASMSGDEDGTIEEYRWFFPDGTETTSFYMVQHQFLSAGDHEVTLQIVDDDNGRTNVTKTVTVLEPGEDETETTVQQNQTSSAPEEQATGSFAENPTEWWPWILLLLLIITAYLVYRRYG